MEKTKLGMSVGLMGATVFLIALVGGYTPLLLIGGYIFFKEDNLWLKKNVVKAFVISLVCSIAYYALGLIPDVLGLLLDAVGLAGLNISLSFINNIVYLLRDAVNILETVILLLCGLTALNMGSVKFAFVDDIVEKHMN